MQGRQPAHNTQGLVDMGLEGGLVGRPAMEAGTDGVPVQRGSNPHDDAVLHEAAAGATGGDIRPSGHINDLTHSKRPNTLGYGRIGRSPEVGTPSIWPLTRWSNHPASVRIRAYRRDPPRPWSVKRSRASVRSCSSHHPVSATVLCSSSYARWSRSWSGTAMASRFPAGLVGSPRGTAQDRSTPPSSSRRSKCGRGRRWSCSTKAGRAPLRGPCASASVTPSGVPARPDRGERGDRGRIRRERAWRPGPGRPAVVSWHACELDGRTCHGGCS